MATTRNGSPPRSGTRISEFTFSVYQQVATRRYVDEQAIWTVMRFADEPAERAPSRQITRYAVGDARGHALISKRDFDELVERLDRRAADDTERPLQVGE